MLSAVEHALLKWKMQSSVVEHEASQVIYRYGFMFSWVDAKMAEWLNSHFVFSWFVAKTLALLNWVLALKKKKSTVAKLWMMSVLFRTLTLNAHKSVKLCEFWTFYWYLCDLLFTCACFISNQNAHSVDTLTNFSNFAIYEMLPNDIMSK